MAALAKNRMTDGRIDADETSARGLGSAGGASLALHAGVAAVLVWLTWTTLREPVAEREPEVFQVVPVAGASAASAANARDNREATSEASVTERLFVAPPSVRSWTPPPPPPARAEERVETRVPARPESVRAEPVRDSGRGISYEEYRRLHGAPSANDRRPQTTTADRAATPGAVSHINVSQIRGDLGIGAVSTTSASAGDTGTAMQEYFSDLLRRLRESHKLPQGVDGGLRAETQFTVAANGAVSDASIVRSSGSKEFDQSVLEAFHRVKMRARPDGKTEVHRLIFRLME